MLKKSNQKMNNSDIKLKKDETQINPDLKQENESKNDSNELNKEEINTNLNSELTKEKDLNMDIKISKSEFIEDEQNKYYIPICRESGCNGYLEFDFDNKDFFIKYNCHKNNNHNSNNLYYETFEKFYLKEKYIPKCYKCNIFLENKDKYKCVECNKLYCISCFLSDMHIRKNWINLQIITNKCSKDKNELTYFCKDCQQKVCPFCLRILKNYPHKKHEIESILDEIPSSYILNSLKEKILKKEKYYEKIFESLDEWLVELNKKIERIKENLRTEIRILKKIFFNYNQNCMDYNYYIDCFYFNNNINEYNNIYLKNFMKSKNFEEKIKCIFDLLSPQIKKPEQTKTKLVKLERIGKNGILECFDDKYLLLYSELENEDNEYDEYNEYNEENTIKLISFDGFDEISKIKINDKIKSFNFSPDKKKIYVCLKNEKTILIIEYNSKNNELKLSDEKIEIKDGANDNFNYCFIINDNNIITIDDKFIYLWNKTDLNSSLFTNTKKKDLFCTNLYDVCQINEKYLLISHYNILTFFSIENLSIEKKIEDVDCVKNKNEKSIILINDCALVNCIKGIAIVSIKNKEIIQYIENWDNFKTKKIYKSIGDYIFISNSFNDLFKFRFIDYNLELFENIKITDVSCGIDKKSSYSYDLSYSYDYPIDVDVDVDIDSFHFTDYKIIINKDEIFIWDYSIYRLEFQDSND